MKETKVNHTGQIMKTAITNEQSHEVFQTAVGMLLSAMLTVCSWDLKGVLGRKKNKTKTWIWKGESKRKDTKMGEAIEEKVWANDKI